MDTWKTYKLGEICLKIGSGSTPRGGSAVYQQQGTAFIRSQNVYNFHFETNGLVYLGEKEARHLQSVSVKEGDILLNITGDSVARTCLVPSIVLPARVSQHVMIVRIDPTIALPKYISFVLASPSVQRFLLSIAVGRGASRNALTKEQVANLSISLPPLEEQERIAGVLGAYDDLIAVNERRMALLEEAAHRLFHDRFVTHADPDWSRRPLGEVIKFVRGRSYTSTELEEPTSDKGVLLINLKNLRPFGGYLRGEEKRFLGKWREDQCVEQGDILMGVTDMTPERRLVGHVARVPKLQERAVFSMDLVKLEPLACEKEFLFGFLSQPQCGKLFSAFANGATVSHLRPDTLVDEPVLNPPLAVQRNYGQQVQPLYEAIDVLAAQNALLRAGRDKLLPRLLREEA